MSGAVPDLIAGYLEELCAGLRVPTAEAELIAAEAEDHLRETVAAGLRVGMTEREAQEAAISSFGPVRAVVRAHRRRTVTVAAVAMAAWKLTALLATTVGAGSLAGMVIFAYLLRSAPGGGMWQALVSPPLLVYAAIAAGGLILLATRRLARLGTWGRDLLSPWVTALCFLLASAPLRFLLLSAPATPTAPSGVSCPWSCNLNTGPAPNPGPALTVLAVCAAIAAGGLILLATRRLARLGTWGRDLLSPWVAALCFLLVSASLAALIVSDMPVLTAPVSLSWTTPYSYGSVSAAPLVAGAVGVGCLTVAVGYGARVALRRAWARAWVRRALTPSGQADRGRTGRACV